MQNPDEMKDDITFYMQGWEPQGKPKAVVCLIHGLGEHSGRYAHVGNAFNKAGYSLYGFDLRGHGQSGAKRGHIPSLDVAMEDIHQFVEFQRQNHPNLPVFLYGHSLGGMLTLTYVLQHSDGLNGVVVTGAGLRSPLQKQKAKVALARMLGALAPGFTLASGLDPSLISRDPEEVEKYVHDPLVHNKVSAGLGLTMLNGIDYCWEHAREFKPPLFLMHGTADNITYASGSEDFARLAGESNQDVTLKLWEGMYHEIHNELGKEEVIQTMIEWMDRHL